jgi:hypothetical protein
VAYTWTVQLKNQQIFELIRKARKCIAVINLVMIHLIFQNELMVFMRYTGMNIELIRMGTRKLKKT